jgi:hypothetical protein
MSVGVCTWCSVRSVDETGISIASTMAGTRIACWRGLRRAEWAEGAEASPAVGRRLLDMRLTTN